MDNRLQTSSGNDDIKVSVVMTTYNHEKYIRQAIDSILMQNTSFGYEILIGDDASRDATPTILIEYADRYPGFVNIFLRKKNLGASKNCYDLLSRAKGTYVAGIDGDDFWTDKNKLQIQADFLDKHPQYSGCSHVSKIVNEDGEKSKIKGLSWISEKKIFSLKDFKGIILPGHPSTIMRRNFFLDTEHDYSIIYKAHPMICDRTIAMLSLSFGEFYKIDRCMGVYRLVLKKGGDNLTSKLYIDDEDYIYNDFLYTDKLQKYANETLHIDAGFDRHKQELFATAVYHFIRHPSRKKINSIKKILADADSCYYYFLRLPYYIISKIIKRMRHKFLWQY